MRSAGLRRAAGSAVRAIVLLTLVAFVFWAAWYDEKGKASAPEVHYFVGGATKLFGAAPYRLRTEDLGELQHQDGVSPAWPISYEELEPCYTQAEQLYCVHGERGETAAR
jgi:choline dehydrogenase-like flavoprotein